MLGIIIVSDSAPVAGLPDGTYKDGDWIADDTYNKFYDWIDVEIKKNICVMLGTNTLAGRYTLKYTTCHSCLFTMYSVSMMDKCVVGMMEATGK